MSSSLPFVTSAATPATDANRPERLRHLAAAVLLHAIRVARTKSRRCWWDYTDTPEDAAAFLRGDPGHAEDLAYWCRILDFNYDAVTRWARASGWEALPDNWNYTWSEAGATDAYHERIIPRFLDGQEHLIDSDFRDAIGNIPAFFRILSTYCDAHDLAIERRTFKMGEWGGHKVEHAFKIVPRTEATATAVATADSFDTAQPALESTS